MNKTYRLIWNHRLNAWIVASELTRTSGKKASGRTRAGVAAVVLALSTSLPLAAADLSPGALPTGGTVVAGQADIAASGTRMDITQGSQKAIINWQGFDIGSQAQVNFAQPNASAVALNRVSGPTATRIEGQLTANGQVFLVNPNGVLFGNGARVNAGAFVASTLNIRDDDFLAGNYSFTGTGGAIENRGTISAAPGGYVAFIAQKITNAGTVSAPQGTVAMGAGERVTLNFAGDRLVGLSVAAETLDTLIENRQAIRAEGGAILLTAAGAETVTRSVINNSGVLEAGSLTADGGRIVLTAGNDINLGTGSSVAVDGKKGGEIRLQAQSGTLLADGNISARGASGSGGGVQLLGRQVGLINAAQVDASGATGGGSVLVGGDYQGGNAEVANARATYVAPDVTIKANALQQGDGGKVIVWANEIARFYGTISADGAGTGGNGGFVETSGKAVLDASGNVSALGAGGGRAGSWLLDPYDITIQTAGSNTNVTASPNFTSNGNSAIVTTGSIQTALNAGTSVTVTTGAGGAQAGNITVANAIAKSAGGNASLTFNATNNIVFNTGANVTSTVGALGLTVNAGGAITTLRGVSLNGGTLTLNAAGAVTQSSAITGNTTVVKNGAGTFTLSQNNTYTGATNINAGTLALGAANRIADTSAVTVASGATFNLANFAETVGSLAGAGNVTLGSATLTAGGNNTSTIFSGVASGTGGLTKAGTGTLTLSGANTYTGATTINAGTLTATGGSAIADNSQVTLANAAGATLNLTNNETIGNLSGGGATGGNVALGANTLTVNEAGATTYSGVVSGTGGLTKAGAGTLTLGGINTYTGATSINAGTLALNATGTIAASFGVANAGNFSIAAAKTIDSMTGAGTTALGANTLTIGDASNTSSTYTGVISGTGGLVKAGVGTLTLGGANTYTGTTTISAGTLRYGAGNAIAGGAVVVNNGGTYDLNNFSDTIGALTVNSGTTGGTVTTGAGTLTLGGNVTSTGGAANATISGNLALGGNRTFTTTNAADGLTVSAVISGANTLTKAGNGTLTLSGVNTYTGTTTISTGTLVAASNSALGSTTAGTTVANNANLTLQGGITVGAEALSLTGTGVGNNGALRNLSGNNSWGGTVTLAGTTEIQSDAGTLTLSAANSVTGTNRALTIDGAGNTAINGTITTGTGTLTKNGTGTLTLSGNNTYTGTTTVNAGTLVAANNTALGTTAGGTTVANGATLALQGGITVGAEALNISGTGVGGDGVLRNLGGNNTLGGTVTLAANAEIQSDAGTLTLSAANSVTGATRNLSVDGAGNTTISGTITTTSGTLTKNGTGTLTLSGGNTYTGATAINAGTLAVTANNALGTAAAGTTVASGAMLDFRNVPYATAEAVTLNGGTLATSIGTSNFAGPVTLGANSNVDVGGTQLTLSGAISGTGFGIAKEGSGTLVLSGTNTYTGATNINAGMLVAANAAALGGIGGGTNVGSNARLRIDGVALGAEPVTLNGLGLFNQGAITSNGAASLAGPVTLAADAAIAPNNGSMLTLSGPVDGAFGLTTGGFGTLNLNGAVGGVTPLAFLTTLATAPSSATRIGTSVRTTGNQTYNNPTTLGAGAALQSTGGNISLNGVVTASGAVSLQAAGDLLFQNSGSFGTLAATAGGTVTLGPAGQLAATGTGDAIVLSGSRFVNSAGAGALTATNGRWLVWSSNSNPFGGATPDNRGGLAYGFKQYNATYGVTPVQGAGNGFLYTVAPIITPSLTGTVSKVYDGNNTAMLAPANLIASGAVDGDSVVLAAASAIYDSRNVGTGKTVTATGITASASNGTAAVYGYTVSPSSASGPVGEITPAALTVSSIGAVSTTYGTPAATGAVSLNGVISGDSVTSTASLVGPTYSTSGNLSAGSYAQSAGSLGGADAGNYTLTAYTTPTNNYSVGQLALTGAAIAASGSTYGSALNPGAVTFGNVIAGDVVTSTAGVNTSTLSSSGNPIVGNYTQTAGAIGGTDAANYSFGGYTTPAANYTIGQAALSVAGIAGVSTTYGTPAATGAVSLNGVISGDSVTSTASLVGPTYSTSGNLSAGSYAQSAGSLGGADAGNYTLTAYTTPTNNYSVGQLALTGSILASDKVYDSTTAAIISNRSLSGVVVGDSVSYVGGIANFSDKNVGAAKTVTGSGLGLSGADAGNYTVNSVASTTASITPAPLTLNAVSDTKVYDGTTGSSGVVGTVGLQGSDSVGNLSQSYASKNVLGTNASTLAVNGGYIVNDGNGGANYSVTTTTAKGTISPAPLTIAANDASKLFGTPNPPFTATYSGFVGGETPSVLNGALSFQTVAGTTSPPGNYAITPYGQTSSNYAIVFRDGVLTINGSPSGPGDAGATGADQQAIGAQYTSQGAPTLALAMIQYIRVEGDCLDETATPHGSCAGQPPGTSLVRVVNGGISMPRQ